ncbi:ABC transporter ATP-binding protein [Leeia sp. TBRC 13508]|uniref:ABC transporter ATP-binding protein n=1 Tax=Leeia speluncae TaxID=2884804 RepID=A0ABS8D4P1_9NEIS|nr:ABC transporter ATP-binding protein [Leeia speluncae]MCB6183158.1 ABC transporter ATP-binding protein [Leeia speluncae]
MSDHELIIDVQGLNKRFGDRHVVKDLTLQVEKGQIYGFLGPNGSGKTTSIRMLCGLLTPDSGQGHCLGLDVIQQSAEIKRQVGYMTQKFSLWEDLSIRENLEFVGRLFEVRQRRQKVDETLETLGLTSRQHQLAGTLSGGWKQRLALASCLLHSPKLLLLDEPTAGVDPQARREFWEEIHRLSAEGITVLVSTHYMDEAERCHRLAYIAYGDLLETGTVAEILARQQLCTWQIHGALSPEAILQLKQHPNVEHVTSFGNALHVSGKDADQLGMLLAPFTHLPDIRIEPIQPTLEDAFIHLMKSSQGGKA